MDSLPIAPQQFSLGGGQASPANIGEGLAKGLEIGNKMGYVSSQTKAQDLANQYQPLTMKLKQQEMAMQIQEKQALIQKQKADAINGVGQIAPILKLLPMKNARELLSSHLGKIQSIYGNIPLDPSKITEDNIDEVQQWAKGRPEIEKLNSPDALTTYDSYWISQMGETQRQMVQDIKPVSPQEMFSQGKTDERTKFTQGMESQRASAASTASLVNAAYSVNLAKTALSKGNELNDYIAINEFGKLINNGQQVPLSELLKMAKAGTWGPKVSQVFEKFTGEGALSPDQRAFMQNVLDTVGESVKEQTATKASQYPGATPPSLPSISAYKIGQAVNFSQGTYKKIKEGPDTDQSTWQLVPSAKGSKK